MKKPDDIPNTGELRKLAEEQALQNADQQLGNLEALSLAETRQILHELRVRQIELEMLNEELLKSERQRLLVYSIPAAIVVHGVDTRIILSNSKAHQLLGLTGDQLMGKMSIDSDWNFLDTDGEILPQNLYPVNQVLADRKPLREMVIGIPRLDHLDPIWVLANAVPVFNNKDEIQQVIVTFVDITERKKSEEALRESEERLRVAAGSLDGILYVLDTELRFTLSKGRGLAILGLKPDQVVGMSMYDFLQTTDPDHPSIAAHLSALAGEVINIETSRGVATFSTTISPMKNAQGEIVGVVGLAIDITERKQAELELKHLSHHDALTGLYNRSFFTEEMARLDRGRQFPVSIVMGDVDHLKETNDNEGHAAGDALLKRIARVLTAAFRADEIAARIGGDEFAVLLPNTDATAAENALRRLRLILEKHNAALLGTPVRVSFGVSTAEKQTPLTNALKEADKNMYREKRRRDDS